MQLTFNKRTALAILRIFRADQSRAVALRRRTNILPPDPAPRKRWSRKLLDSIDLGIPYDFAGKDLYVATPDNASRLRTRGVDSTIYASGVPNGSFIDLNGFAISGPELIFAELAGEMHPIEHLMLGHELCGSFCRAADDPYNGRVVYFIEPVTSVEKIRRFLNEAKGIRNIEAARVSAAFLNDNAWSPTESLVAALMRLPIDNLGYDLGKLVLNPRVKPEHVLPGSKDSRVPDIIIADTPVGVNYDGLKHLDLDSIAKAAIELSANPGIAQTEVELKRTIRDVREKALDDIRRNRELAAEGFSVFPLLMEDLYVRGGMDQVVAQLIDQLERLADRDMSRQKRFLRGRDLARERFRMMLSLLPGKHERDVHVARFIQGHMLLEGPMKVHECWIDL